ncbi:hexose transport-related protein [Phaffia rhodozyma]|uniref:Hexose transport-related protein n=1 Tax=Phaffia rhodozyma TaxID=264483 RepID=A0A0F7SRR6_PHARH|nr:hexose transport-related protein [Phaffia rhodozyma]
MHTPDWKKIPNASDHLKWYENKGKLKLDFFLSIIFVGMVLNGFDGTIISRILALDVWTEDIGNPSASQIGVLNAVPYMSGFVVGPFITWLDSRYGRRWGLRFYGYTMIIGTVIGCVAGLDGVNGYGLFVTSRFIIGFGLASFLMTSLIVVQEISHPRSRSIVAASWDSYWILGSVIASFLIFGTSYIQNSWAWRIPYLVQLPMAFYIVIGVQFVPETPRFLMAKGREDEAFKFFVDYHGNGNPNDELVLYEFDLLKKTLQMEAENKEADWSMIIKNKGSLHRLSLAALMAFMTGLSGSSIVYYYYTEVLNLVGITDTTTQTGIGAGLSMFTWFCQIAAVYLDKRIGKKTVLLWVWPTLLLGLIGMCVSSGVFANTGADSKSAGIATVAMLWIYLGFFNFANPVLYSYPAEVQTYSLRSKGLLVWNTLNQCMGVYATWVDVVALESIGYKYYIVYMPLVIIQWCLAYRYMVETHSYTLEEITQAFDGPDAVVPIIDKIQSQELPAYDFKEPSVEDGLGVKAHIKPQVI